MMKLVNAILGVVGLLLSAITTYLLFLSDQSFVDLVTSIVGGNTYAREIVTSLLSAEKILMIKAAFLILSAATIFLTFRFRNIYPHFRDVAVVAGQSLMVRVKNSWPHFLLVATIPIVLSLYFAFHIPVEIDEAFTYLNFSSRSPVVSLTYYPAPNNHIFFSLLTSLSTSLPFGSQLLLLRLPSVLIYIFTLFAFFSFTREYLTQNAAILATAVFGLLFSTLYYGFLARGYGLLMLCFIMACYAAFKIVESPNRLAWLVFIVFSILGFYTMPSFLYPYLALNLFVLLSDRSKLSKLLLSGVITVAIVTVLYLPVILVNGLEALAGNEYVRPISRATVIAGLPAFLLNTLEVLFGYPAFLILALFIAALIVVTIAKPKLATFALTLILAPILFLIIHSVLPFPRTLIFFTAVIIFILAAASQGILSRLSFPVVLGISLAIQVAQAVQFNSQILQHQDKLFDSHKVVEQVAESERIYVNAFLFDLYLEFYYKSQAIERPLIHTVTMPHTSADSLLDTYDVVVIDKEKDQTKDACRIPGSVYYNVYKKCTTPAMLK